MASIAEHLDRLHVRVRRSVLNRRPGISLDAGVIIGPHTLLSPRFRDGGRICLGRGTRCEQGVIVDTWGGQIEVASEVFIGPYTIIYGQGPIAIGSRTMIAGQCFIVANTHDFRHVCTSMRHASTSGKGITVGDDVWIGAGVKVLDGVSIGNGAVVGAGAVVTRAVEAHQIVAGVPARVIGRRVVSAGLDSN